jgi:hypothetical protein
MLKLRYDFLIILCLALFSGCEKEIELDLEEHDQRLAIFSLFTPNSIIANNSSFIVEVSSTQSILDNSEPEFINDAEVTIIATAKDSPVDPVSERLTSSVLGDRPVYRTDVTLPQNGFEYELQIDHPDFPKVTAKSVIPPITNITSIEFDTFKKSKENELPGITRYFTNVEIEVPNNVDQDDFYHLLVWRLENNILSPIDIGREVLQEQLGTDAIVVNVDNSRVFFGAHFSDQRFVGNNQAFNFDISFLLGEEDNPSDIIVELRSVSKEYHRYFVDGFRLTQGGDNSFFVNSDNITNNIEGGFGIFAGYTAFNSITPFRK